MVSWTRKKTQYRRKGQSLIAANKIKPQLWHISEAEAKEALIAQGQRVHKIKKIHKLKHQVCISYWNESGGVCSSFFSYRIFARWQNEVEKLIYTCPSVSELAKLQRIMRYEFAYYNYLREIEDALDTALEKRLSVLKATSLQAVFTDNYVETFHWNVSTCD
jgi:type II secretory pathway component PulF